MRLRSGIAALSLLLPSVAAWGPLGHRTVAYLASTFVQEETAAYFKHLLKDETEDYLASVATLNDEEVIEAAKFLIHFIGDIHQPLHTEDVLRGGTELWVKWHGHEQDLHRVWDSSILEEMVGNHDESPFNRAHDLAESLASEIRHGKYTADSKKWLIGMNLDNPNITTMNWANEVNDYVCTTVLPVRPKDLKGQPVDGAYAENAEPVIDTLLARAGYRLAAWLNLIASRMNESARAASVGGEL
ncbi:hypothetical protein E8E14_009584 [Neopestalotiopsis sp. 37M]|nr:hypothetical protein E8E14_009584 [Neopestalotiopsis sp. 37M]